MEPGKLADMDIWNKDYFTVPLSEFPTVYPDMVILGGKIVDLRNEFAREIRMAPVGPQLKYSFEFKYNFGRPLKIVKKD